jgi:hypothetical protein
VDRGRRGPVGEACLTRDLKNEAPDQAVGASRREEGVVHKMLWRAHINC